MIARLMGHYWAADTPIEIRRELARDWLDDLREFGPMVIAEACGEWRRTQTRRPTPADIRALAIEARAVRQEGERLRALPRPDHAAQRERRRREQDEMARQGRDTVTAWAQERGFATLDDYALAAGIGIDAAYRQVITGILAGAADKLASKRDAAACDDGSLGALRQQLGLDAVPEAAP